MSIPGVTLWQNAAVSAAAGRAICIGVTAGAGN